MRPIGRIRLEMSTVRKALNGRYSRQDKGALAIVVWPCDENQRSASPVLKVESRRGSVPYPS